jgi:hypothetical protein
MQRTSDCQPAALEHMSVHHGGFDILVAEQLLDGANVVSVLE